MNSILVDTLNADQRRALDNLRAASERIWARPLHRTYTDHTPAHSARIVALLDGLTPGPSPHWGEGAGVRAAEYDPLVHGGETLRLRLLAALLRFGDELDIDHRRVDLEQMKLLALPEDSLLHWWKCHYVSGVSIEDETIRIVCRFPETRPDYEGLIVPLVEGEIRAKHAALGEIFRTDAVKVALGKSQVRLMRLVQPLPPEVEVLARETVLERLLGWGYRVERAMVRMVLKGTDQGALVDSCVNLSRWAG